MRNQVQNFSNSLQLSSSTLSNRLLLKISRVFIGLTLTRGPLLTSRFEGPLWESARATSQNLRLRSLKDPSPQCLQESRTSDRRRRLGMTCLLTLVSPRKRIQASQSSVILVKSPDVARARSAVRKSTDHIFKFKNKGL